MRVATFNLQNLRLRRRGGEARLDGARDGDLPEDAGAAAEALDEEDRRLTAEVLAAVDADAVALQEVFDQATLDHFHDRWLARTGARPWPFRVCLPGNDGRGFDVAVMSRRPFRRVVSHAAATARGLGLEPVAGVEPDDRVFRRDCLEVDLEALTLFVVHLKAPYPKAEAAWAVRRLEAQAVRRVVETSGAGPLWLIMGDFNEPRSPPRGRARAAGALLDGFAVDLLERLPEAERWSWRSPDGGRYSRPDAVFASPELARRWPDAAPWLVRAGMGREAARWGGGRLPGVGRHRPHASDHAALCIEFPGL